MTTEVGDDSHDHHIDDEDRIRIAEVYRRQGIAKALLDALDTTAISAGCHGVWVDILGVQR